MEKIEIYLNEDIADPERIPLITLKIEGKNAIFAKQLASTFESSVMAKDLLKRLRESGVYTQDESYKILLKKELEEIQRWEKITFGKSATQSLLSPISPNGAAVIYEEPAIWLLARSNSQKGKEFAKFLVRTFLDVRDGRYIEAEHIERIRERRQFSEAEKQLKTIIYERGIQKSKDISIFVLKGDQAFYNGYTTQQIRKRKEIPDNRPLADFDSSIELTAKTLAKKLTNHSILKKEAEGIAMSQKRMTDEYVRKNKNMRESLTASGIQPEDTPKEIDYRTIEKEAKRALKKAQGLKRLN